MRHGEAIVSRRPTPRQTRRLSGRRQSGRWPPGCALVNRALPPLAAGNRALPPLAAGAVPVLRAADRAANGLRYAYADASRRASPVTHGPDLKETQAPK
jgi:hypothetical protein